MSNVQESPEKLKEDLSMIGLLVESISEVHGSPVLEVEVTSNRPDCLSHIGIAREVSALYQRPLKNPPVQETLSASPDTIPYNIEIRDADLCPRYVGLVMDGIRIEPSPAMDAAAPRSRRNASAEQYRGYYQLCSSGDGTSAARVRFRRAAPGKNRCGESRARREDANARRRWIATWTAKC